jgi:DNA repair protein RadC
MSLALAPTTSLPHHAPTARPEPEPEEAALVGELIRDGEPVREARARAERLLAVTGGLAGLRKASPGLLSSHGLPDRAVATLRAALCLAPLLNAPPLHGSLDAAAVANHLRPTLAHLGHEEMHVVLLDAAWRFAGRRRIASGNTHAVAMEIRDVLLPVVETRAPHFVMAHNHPSGKCRPSAEDVALTGRIEAAAMVLGLRLVDHLVIAEDGHASAMPEGARWPAPRGRQRSV